MEKTKIEQRELGLNEAEVQERKAAGLINKAVEAPSKTIGEIIASNVFTYFNFVFLVLAALLISVRSFRDLSFLPLIFINSLIGILQELRAKQILDKLIVLSAPEISVMRNGEEKTIKTHSLVMDDVMVLTSGFQIPADAIVIDGEVAVNESLLTGESDDIVKKQGDELFSGSFVVYGKCYAKVIKVGSESYAAKLTMKAKAIRVGEQSEILRSLNSFVKLAGIAIIPIGIIMFGQQYFLQSATAKVSIQAMVAAIMGMIPEGLFLLASVTLVLSAVRLAQKKVLVHDMKCIETLARVDVLCVDKTGTITSDRMNVERIEEIESMGKENRVIDVSREYFEPLLATLVEAQADDNETMQAIKRYFNNKKITNEVRKKLANVTGSIVKILGFSSKYKYSGVCFKKKTLVIGAPEFVLRDDFKKYAKTFNQFTEKGYRTLVFGEYQGCLETKKDDGEMKLTEKVVPLLVIALSNEIRATAPATFQYFKEQGVKIKVISGDNARTVSEVAKMAGVEGAEEYIDISTVKDTKEFKAAVLDYTVFGRVKPEEKLKMVKILKAAGRTVAMTGDGVNDVLALKEADCSVAMASGSQAAVQASQLVLLESDFAKMPAIVKEGRQVVNNLERSGSLFLVKNIFSFIGAVLSISFGMIYPLLPTQVSLVTMFTIGVPSFFLAQIPNQNLIKGNFILNVLSKATPAAITNVVVIWALVFVTRALNINRTELGMLCVLAWEVVGLVYLYRVCRPFDNIWKKLIVGGCGFGMIFCMIFLQDLFGVTFEISYLGWIIFAVTACLVLPAMIFFERLLAVIYYKFFIGFVQDKIIEKKIFRKF
mgnify:FL=1